MSIDISDTGGATAPVREDLRARRRRETMFEVHRIAVDLFLRNGYAETTVEEVAQAAGVSQSTFFRYFPQKDDVVAYAYENMGSAHSGFSFAGGIEDALLAVEENFARQFQAMTASAADSFAQLQNLLEKEPVLRASMHEYIDRDFERLRETLTTALGDEHEREIRLLLHIAGGTVHVSVDTWLAEDIHEVSLAETYESTRTALRGIARAIR